MLQTVTIPLGDKAIHLQLSGFYLYHFYYDWHNTIASLDAPIQYQVLAALRDAGYMVISQGRQGAADLIGPLDYSDRLDNHLAFKG